MTFMDKAHGTLRVCTRKVYLPTYIPSCNIVVSRCEKNEMDQARYTSWCHRQQAYTLRYESTDAHVCCRCKRKRKIETFSAADSAPLKSQLKNNNKKKKDPAKSQALPPKLGAKARRRQPGGHGHRTCGAGRCVKRPLITVPMMSSGGVGVGVGGVRTAPRICSAGRVRSRGATATGGAAAACRSDSGSQPSPRLLVQRLNSVGVAAYCLTAALLLLLLGKQYVFRAAMPSNCLWTCLVRQPALN
jgi:hypothetical protein